MITELEPLRVVRPCNETSGCAAAIAAAAEPSSRLAELRSSRSTWSSLYLPCKVACEWLLAAILLVAGSPLVLVLAIIVKLSSSGPAFYSQTRLGLRGRPYRIYKLRQMTHNAEAHTGPVWAVEDDPRITSLGRFLRDTHLDELPQLWNVLRGDMGLIGPRPERPEISARLERSIPGYMGRLAIRPGVTGLAQMLLPADSDLAGVKKKLSHDLYYVRHVSLWQDLRISLCTGFYFLGAACKGMCRALVKSYGAHAMRGAEALNADGPRCHRCATCRKSVPLEAVSGS